jgi:predicted alpha/beta-fold hydrolase
MLKKFLLREILKTEDGDQFMLEWLNQSSSALTKTIVLIITGVLETTDKNHVTHYVDIAKKMNCIAVVKNYRGLRSELLKPRIFMCSDYKDLDQTVQHIKKLYPHHRVFAVGISLGRSSLFS